MMSQSVVSKQEKKVGLIEWSVENLRLWVKKYRDQSTLVTCFLSPLYSIEEYKFYIKFESYYSSYNGSTSNYHVKISLIVRPQLPNKEILIIDHKTRCHLVICGAFEESNSSDLLVFSNNSFSTKQKEQEACLASFSFDNTFDISKLIDNDKFIINCELAIYNEIHNRIDNQPSSCIYFNMENEKQLKKLQDLMVKVFQDDQFSDVKFFIDGKELPSHKNILVHCSDVFKAMLSTDMVEKEEGKIIITDFNYDVFKDFLTYLYYGKLNNFEKNASDFLRLADKYNIEDLKSICEEYLVDHISPENISSLFQLATLYGADNLKYKIASAVKEKMGQLSTVKIVSLLEKQEDFFESIK